MKLIDELQRRQTTATKNRIIRYVGTDKKRFRELVDVFLGDNYRATQWAGWPLSDLVKKHPSLIRPYLRSMLRNVDRADQHEAVRRNVMRLLQFVDIPPSLQGLAFDKAFSLFSDTSQSIAVRVFAMTVMADIAVSEPDLRNEVIAAIESYLPYGSPAYRSRAAKLLKKLRTQ